MAERTNWFRKLLRSKSRPPRVPDGVTVYAVGDIHGRYDLLLALLEKIWADAAPTDRNTLVFLGDYVDRGQASAEVVEYLTHLERPGWDIIKLMGNHEYSLLEFWKNAAFYASWKTFGGADTLLSYGVRPPMFSDPQELDRAHRDFTSKFPRTHFAFLSDLPYTHEVGDYLFVHAGVRPGLSLSDQDSEDLLWIRDDFLLSEQDFGKVVVHGHTPTDAPVVRSNRIGIDTGAYATNRLTAVRLIQDQREFLSASL